MAGAQSLSTEAWDSLPEYPRLFAKAAQWKVLKQQIKNDEISKSIFSVVRDTAVKLLDQPPVEYVDKGAFWHGPMRQAQGRILSLAMMFRLTGEQRFLVRAKLEMQTMAELPNWYPQHFLDTAERVLGHVEGHRRGARAEWFGFRRRLEMTEINPMSSSTLRSGSGTIPAKIAEPASS